MSAFRTKLDRCDDVKHALAQWHLDQMPSAAVFLTRFVLIYARVCPCSAVRLNLCVRLFLCVCFCACVPAYVRLCACVCACACLCVHAGSYSLQPSSAKDGFNMEELYAFAAKEAVMRYAMVPAEHSKKEQCVLS